MLKEYTIKSNKSKEEYSVVLNFDDAGVIIPQKTTCTCKHGSFYRFTQTNIASGRWQCAHIKEAIKKYKNNEPDNIQLEQEANNGKRDTKPIYPIFQ
jgi:hypothetical protein